MVISYNSEVPCLFQKVCFKIVKSRNINIAIIGYNYIEPDIVIVVEGRKVVECFLPDSCATRIEFHSPHFALIVGIKSESGYNDITVRRIYRKRGSAIVIIYIIIIEIRMTVLSVFFMVCCRSIQNITSGPDGITVRRVNPRYQKLAKTIKRVGPACAADIKVTELTPSDIKADIIARPIHVLPPLFSA